MNENLGRVVVRMPPAAMAEVRQAAQDADTKPGAWARGILLAALRTRRTPEQREGQ